MPFYAAPGVYVEEVPGGARPIGAVGTSTAAFVGAAPDREARLNQAYAVNSWSGFVRTYAADATEATPLALAVYGFFENGGGRCYVVNTEDGAPIAGGRERTGLRALEAIDEVAIVAAPGRNDPDSWDALLTHCEKLEDRVAVLDTVPEVDDVERLTRVATATAEPAPTGRRRAAGAAGAEPAAGEAPAEAEAGERPSAGDHRRPGGRPPPPEVGVRQLLLPAPADPGPLLRRAGDGARRAGTWPGSGPAPTSPAACTRRRRTRSCAARST